MSKKPSPQNQVRLMAAHAHAVAAAKDRAAPVRIVVAVIGRDRPGIMASVTAMLAARAANILDVSQTIMSDLFTMVMLVDINNASVPFATLKADLEAHGQSASLVILVQHEDIFRAMHRV